MSFNCQFCKKGFSSKYTLSNHLKTARYCIKNRSTESNIQIETISFNCNICHKQFTRKEKLISHNVSSEELHNTILVYQKEIDQLKFFLQEKDNIIKDKDKQLADKDKIIIDKDKTIEDLQNKLYKLASRPTFNQTNNNLVNFEASSDLKLAQQFKVKPINTSQIYEAVGKHYGCNRAESIAIKDVSRDNYEFRMNDEIHSDKGGFILTGMANLAYKDVIAKLVNETKDIITAKIDSIKKLTDPESMYDHNELLKKRDALFKIERNDKIERKPFLAGLKSSIFNQKTFNLLTSEMDKHPEEYYKPE